MTSRRLVLSVLAIVLASLTLCAQNRTGLKAGATISQWKYASDNNPGFDVKTLSNFAIVISQEFRLGSIVSIQIEPTYSTRSLDMSILKDSLQRIAENMTLPSTLPNTLSYTQDFVSIECPVLLKVGLTKSGIRPYLFAGPNVAFNISATATMKFDTTNANLPQPVDVKPSAKSAVFSVDAGAGIEIPLFLSLALVADARYTFGLGDFSTFSAFSKSVGSAKAADLRIFAGVSFEW